MPKRQHADARGQGHWRCAERWLESSGMRGIRPADVYVAARRELLHQRDGSDGVRVRHITPALDMEAHTMPCIPCPRLPSPASLGLVTRRRHRLLLLLLAVERIASSFLDCILFGQSTAAAAAASLPKLGCELAISAIAAGELPHERDEIAPRNIRHVGGRLSGGEAGMLRAPGNHECTSPARLRSMIVHDKAIVQLNA